VVVNYQPPIHVGRGADEETAREAIRVGMLRAEEMAQAQAQGTVPIGDAMRIPA
jgi:hypothetical protein